MAHSRSRLCGRAVTARYASSARVFFDGGSCIAAPSRTTARLPKTETCSNSCLDYPGVFGFAVAGLAGARPRKFQRKYPTFPRRRQRLFPRSTSSKGNRHQQDSADRCAVHMKENRMKVRPGPRVWPFCRRSQPVRRWPPTAAAAGRTGAGCEWPLQGRRGRDRRGLCTDPLRQRRRRRRDGRPLRQRRIPEGRDSRHQAPASGDVRAAARRQDGADRGRVHHLQGTGLAARSSCSASPAHPTATASARSTNCMCGPGRPIRAAYSST